MVWSTLSLSYLFWYRLVCCKVNLHIGCVSFRCLFISIKWNGSTCSNHIFIASTPLLRKKNRESPKKLKPKHVGRYWPELATLRGHLWWPLPSPRRRVTQRYRTSSIREILGSNFGFYDCGFSLSSSVLPGTGRDSTSIMPDRFQIPSSSLLILLFAAT